MEESIKELKDRIDELERKLNTLSQRRIFQQQIVPDAIKMRHMGEANRFVRSGLEANRPSPPTGTDSSACYFATDTNKLYVYNGTVWVSTTLT
jgi:hypothetical protein